MRLAFLAVTLVALTSARASAADNGEFEARPNTLYAQVGLATPLGYVGVEAARNLSPSFVVSVGAGMGVAGPQIALMPRAVLGHGRSVLVLGAGVSRGKYTSIDICLDDDSCAQVTGTATWANAEIGGEVRFPDGFSFRYFGGYGRTITDDFVCQGTAIDECRADPSFGRSLVYTGFAFGQAF